MVEVNPNPGAFGSFLRWIDRPGQAVRNVLTGSGQGAARQAGDFLLEAVDALLPGDMIPELSRTQDYVDPSELLGYDPNDTGLDAKAADILLGIATDPLSYVSFGGAGAGKAAAQQIGRQAMLGRAAGAVSEAAEAAGKSEVDQLLRAARPRDELPSMMARQMGVPRPAMSPEAQKIAEIDQLLRSVREQKRGVAREIGAIDEAADPDRVASLIDMARTSGRPDAAMRLEQLAQQEREARSMLSQALKPAADRGRRQVAEQGAATAARQSLDDAIASGLSNSGMSRLRREGRKVTDLLGTVRDRVGSDYSAANLRRVLAEPDLAPYFEQGGMRFMGQQVMGAERAEELLRRAGQSVGRAVERAPQPVQNLIGRAREGLQAGKRGLYRTLGWSGMDKGARALKRGALAAGANITSTRLRNLERVFKGVGDREREVAADIMDGIRRVEDPAAQGGRTYQPLLETAAEQGASADDLIRMRMDALQAQGVEADWDTVRRLVDDLMAESRSQVDEMVRAGVYPGSGIVGESSKVAQGNAPYLRRQYTGRIVRDEPGQITSFDRFDDAMADLAGHPSVIKARREELETPEGLARFLNQQPGLELVRDSAARAVSRAEAQGRAVTQADAMRRVLRDADAVLVRPEDRARLGRALVELGEQDADFARFLDQATKPMSPRGWTRALAKVNRLFKPAAVYGLGIPRLAALTRNQVGAMWQAASVGGPEAFRQEFRRSVQNLPNAYRQMFGKYRSAASKARGGSDVEAGAWGEVGQKLLKLDEAVVESGGDVENVLARLQGEPHLKEAYQMGVMEGFVDSEELMRGFQRGGRWDAAKDFLDAPSAAFQFLEQSFRLGMFLDLRRMGVPPRVAAERVQDAFLDYSIQSVENRTLRDLIPFAAFTAQSIPQQAKLLARRPAVGVGLSQLYDTSPKGDPVMPWIAEQPSLEIGVDEEGMPQHLVGLGLPVEALNMIPNLSDDLLAAGRDVERNIVGSAHPLLKMAYSAGSGRDPFFGGQAFSYARDPLTHQESELGRQYNILSQTGVLQPIDTPLRMAGRLTDERLSPADKALSLLTGARIASNDPDRAAMQILQDQLSRDPRARQYRVYAGGSPDTEAMVSALAELRQARQAANREAQNTQ